METGLFTLITSKISEYEILVNLFIGLLWFVIVGLLWAPRIMVLSPVYVGVLAYFIGLVIGRVGSLILEPLLKQFTEAASYDDFILAEKRDAKIKILHTMKTIYRNISALMVTLIATRLGVYANVDIGRYGMIFYFISSGLFVLFFLSYIKQGKYVQKRIECACNSKEG